MKTKLLFLVGSLETGGKERQLVEIIKNLPKDIFEVHLFAKSLNAHYLSESDIEQHIQSVCLLNREKFKLTDIWKVAGYIKKISPDIVFSFSTTLSHFCLIARLFSSIKYKLINGSIRNAPDKLDFNQRIDIFLYHLYSYVVSNSDAGLRSYNQQGKAGRFVLYNGYDFNRNVAIEKKEAQGKTGFDAGCFNVVMVASLHEGDSKDPMTFVQVAGHTLNIDSSIRFYLVGDGVKKAELEDYVRQYKITNIKFLGLRSDVEMILRASDLSVLTSKTEGISNFIVESMASRVPVITTSGGGTAEIIENGINGYILPFGDYVAIAEKIQELKDNPDRLEEVGNNAEKTIHQKFSIKTMINKFESIISTV